MRTEDLKEYLGIVVAMEKNIYKQENMIERLEKEMNTLGHPEHISVPEKPKEKYTSVLLLDVMGVFFAILGWMLCKYGSGLRLAQSFLGVLGRIGVFLIGICSALNGIHLIFCLGLETSLENARSKEKQSEYEYAMYEYRKQVARDRQRVKKELICKDIISDIIGLLDGKLDYSRQVLETIYAYDVIFPKYRNFIMICSIYEYFCAERCITLGDAYNILENEIRLNFIITQMDKVIKQLNAIQRHQYELCHLIKESKGQVDEILGCGIYGADTPRNLQDVPILEIEARGTELEDVYSAVSSYCEEQENEEQHYMERAAILMG